MRKQSFAVMAIAVVVGFVLVLVGTLKCADAADAGKEPIRIGYLGTLSGPFAAVEPYMTPAIQMVIDDVNAKGGLLGRRVELVTRDNQGDPSIVRQKLDELKAAGVVVVLGSILDPCCPPVSQWAVDNKIPAIIPATARFTMHTTDFNRYTFITGPESPALANVLVKSLLKQNVNSIYYIGADTDVAHDVYRFFWPAMKKAKPSIKDLGATWTGIADMEFTNIISTALAKKPDLILLGLAGPPYANFVQQARRFNMFQKAKVAAGAYVLGAETTSAFGKTYPEGVMATTYVPYWSNEPAMKEFTRTYLARTKLYPADITMEFYVSALAAIEAIKKAGSTDADKMVNALETMSFDTPVGKVHYRDFDHQAILPLTFATSGYSKDFPFAIGVKSITYGEEVYPTKAEMAALGATK